MNINDKIKSEINHLYEKTSENIHSVSVGYKYINNKKTDQIGIIFKVYKKESLDNLSEDEILPNSIEIDGNNYITDVIEEKNIPSAIDCYGNPSDPEILKLRGSSTPFRGGQEIFQFPTVLPANGTYYTISGTLGFFAVDNYDNNLVAVTNAHVACLNLLIASDRVKSSEITRPYNTMEAIAPANQQGKGIYTPGVVTGWGRLCPFIKRYRPLVLNQCAGCSYNKIDAALLLVNPEIEVSHKINHPSTEPDYSLFMPFAESSELDMLLSLNPKLYSVGRTTGPKGWGALTSCSMRVSSVGNTLDINYANSLSNPQVITLSDIIGFKYENNTAPTKSGDSGSVVFGDFNGVRKIVGLAFAGDSYESFFCRIDHISSQLNIRAWDASYVQDRGIIPNSTRNGFEIKSNFKYLTCDFENQASSEIVKVIDGKTYYQVGCTTHDLLPNNTHIWE
jgi:hypothetical protein